MSINENGWSRVEMLAKQHEADQFLHVAPVPPPTQAQQLAFALTDLARCKARIHKDQGCFAESLMWLQQGNIERAKQVLIQGWVASLKREIIADLGIYPFDK